MSGNDVASAAWKMAVDLTEANVFIAALAHRLEYAGPAGNWSALLKHARHVGTEAHAAPRLRWLILNGERCFGTLWKEASLEDIDDVMRAEQFRATGEL
ncbi:hypothetical protein UFOVP119_8 [uncultured Caudovirales phage]|uniref:Uncharacterized protein n=1 Tax=uncultured Caudovirales phage TaxID=2100421 RepID=A0A6J5L7G8_9CAUD|nr:hypothetical protein UFOVP119_8 [uncultured Caudovirales phage]